MFGEYAAIDGRPRSANVEAKASCLVVSMPADAFRELLEAEPTVAKTLLEHFVREIRELTTRVFEFSTLGRAIPHSSGGLAARAVSTCQGKTAREAVTRELNRLAKMGILVQRNESYGSRISIDWLRSCRMLPAIRSSATTRTLLSVADTRPYRHHYQSRPVSANCRG